MGIYGTLWGLVLVHTIFGMPILDTTFSELFSSIPEELFKAARVDGAGFGNLLPNYAADESANLCGCCHSAGHWNLE